MKQKTTSQEYPIHNNTKKRAARKKQSGSGLVIAGLLLIIFAACVVLFFVYLHYFRPAPQPVQEASQPVVSAEPIATAVPAPSTPEPTPAPTAEPEMLYASSFRTIDNGGKYLVADVKAGNDFYSYMLQTTEAGSAAPQVWHASLGPDGRVSDFAETSSGVLKGSDIREDGNHIRYMRADNSVAVLSEDGMTANNVPAGNYVSALVGLEDGNIGVAAWSDQGYLLRVLNREGTGFTEDLPLPDSAMLFVDGAGEYRFFYTSGVECFGVKKDNTQERLFNWTALNISPSRIGCLSANENGFECIVNTFDDGTERYETELVTISKQTKTSTAEKTELSLVSMNPVEELSDAIVDYNRSQEDVRIVLKVMDSAEGDILSALKQYSADELGGKMPDLLDLTGMPYAELAGAGLLEDLYPYLDADSTLSRGDIMSGVLAGMEINGGLYGTASGFTLSTVIGPANVIGQGSSWTFNEYYNITRTMGAGTYPLGAYDTQANVFYDLLGMNLQRFLNYKDLSCNFDQTDFISILEFIQKLPKEYRDTNDAEQVQNGIQLLLRTTLYAPEDIAFAGSDFKSPVFIGLPTISGSGNALNLFKEFAVGSACADKEAAWKFVRSSFENAHAANLWYFPANRSAFEAALNAAKEGNEWSEGISEDQVSQVRTMIESAAVNRMDDVIYSLVWDNIQGYLEGRDTAAGAANYVQTAVQQFLTKLK